MMRAIYLLILISSLVASCSDKLDLQPDQANQFVKYFGGSASDKAVDLKLCKDSTFALTGSMLKNGSQSQAFFIHADRYGNIVNSEMSVFGEEVVSSNSCGNTICQTKDGGFIIAGYAIQSGHTDKDVYVIRLSPEGQMWWSNVYGGNGNDEAFSIKELPSGNILIGGYTESSGNGGKDAWCSMLDKRGNELWRASYGFTNNEICNYITQKDDYYLLVGYSNSYQINAGGGNIFVAKVDTASRILFDIENYGDSIAETSVRCVEDTTGGFVISGNSIFSGVSNIYAAKIKNDIHLSFWEKRLTSTRNEISNCISLYNNKVIITGVSWTNQDADFLIDELDANGTLLNGNKNTISAMGNQVIQSAVVTRNGKLVFAGSNTIEGFSKICLVKTDLPE